MSKSDQTNQSIDRRSLLQHASSTDMSQDLDLTNIYLANDPRHQQIQQLQMQPLFPRQHSLTTQMSNLSPSKSVETISSANDDVQKPERQYHYLPGNAPESPRSLTMPSLIEQSQPQNNTLPLPLYPPYPPQPHPRTFSPMDARNNITGVYPSLGHNLIPFASSNIQPGFIREAPFEKKVQTFSSFLEEKQYETLEEKGNVKLMLDDGPPSIVGFPPSKPHVENTATDNKIMNIGDDDTIVRHITVTKKKKKYPTKCLFVLYQTLLIILMLVIAVIAVIALLEVKRLEGETAAAADTTTGVTQSPTTGATQPPTTGVPPTMANSTTTNRDLMNIEALISNMNATILELQEQVSQLTSQLSTSNSTLNERVIGVEESGAQLNNLIESLNSSLIQTGENTVGPCMHTAHTCLSFTGGLGCLPAGLNTNLFLMNGYRASTVWCEGALNGNESVTLLSGMTTFVKFFDLLTPQRYECGCNLDTPSESTPFLFRCTTNLIQCRY